MNLRKGICPNCEKEFETSHSGKKYCSAKCRRADGHKKHYPTNKTQFCAVARKYYVGHKEQMAQRAKTRRRALKEWVEGIKASLKCSHCAEARPVCLDFHHLDGPRKEHNIGTMISNHRPRKIILQEMAKCIVLCKNCHAVEHS